jgi:hypothetical protein
MILDASEFFKTKYTTSRGQARTKTSGCPDPAPGLITRRRRMPRIKHWFHVSHDINGDEEVWELTDKYGVWGLRVWLQLLSIADRNEGVVKGDLRLLSRSMSKLWGSNSRRYGTGWRVDRARMMLEWMANKHWISIESDLIRISNWLIYNPHRDHKKSPSVSPPTYPILSSPSDPIRSTPSPSADSKMDGKKRELDPKIKEVTDLLFRKHREKFIKCRVMTWIGEAQKNSFPTDLIVETLKSFAPRAGEIENWYPYLDKIIYKLDKDRSRDIHDIEHERNKQETAELAKDMFGDAQVKERAGPYRRRSMSRR